jgi:hypothetical protein
VSVFGVGRAGPGLVNGHRLRTYRGLQANNELIPLADLMRERPKDNDSAEQVSGRYAQAWALTHYLWNKQPARMAAYLKAMDQIENPDWGKLFATYFGEDFNALEAAVKGHVEGM